MTMIRQNITTRKDFSDMITDEEKMDLAKKYHFRCAHCGATTYPLMAGGRGTVDHYIPISKGGVSQSVNYVYLCEKCNKEKGNLILDPEKYLRYIDPKPYAKLRRYFYDYIDSFEYFNRRNLLACDAYTFSVSYEFGGNRKSMYRVIQKNPDVCLRYYSFRKIGPDDMQTVGTFYIDYLKKYHIFASEEAAWSNLEFWDRFGVLYGAYNTHGELRALAPIMLSAPSNTSPIFTMYVFCPFSDKNTRNMASMLSRLAALAFANERHFNDVRVCLGVPSEDPGAGYITGYSGPNGNERKMFRMAYQGFSFPSEEGRSRRNITDLVDDTTADLDNFFLTHDYDLLEWMIPAVDEHYCLPSARSATAGFCRPFRPAVLTAGAGAVAGGTATAGSSV